jgi:hypothetical protein
VGGSFVLESVESKGMLLMVVFKQSQIANGQTTHPASKTNERSRVGEDARDREHQHEKELSGRQDHLGEDVAYGG